MSKVAGYVIVREDKGLEGFSRFFTTIYGDNSSGIAAEWSSVLLGEPNRLAIYKTHLEAEEVMQHLPPSCAAGFAKARVEPLLIGSDMTPSQKSWLLEVQEYLEQHEDVDDGPDGEPQANRAMALLIEMRQLGLAAADNTRCEQCGNLTVPHVLDEQNLCPECRRALDLHYKDTER